MIKHVSDQVVLILNDELKAFHDEVVGLLKNAGGDLRVNRIEEDMRSRLNELKEEGRIEIDHLDSVERLLKGEIASRRADEFLD